MGLLSRPKRWKHVRGRGFKLFLGHITKYRGNVYLSNQICQKPCRHALGFRKSQLLKSRPDLVENRRVVDGGRYLERLAIGNLHHRCT